MISTLMVQESIFCCCSSALVRVHCTKEEMQPDSVPDNLKQSLCLLDVSRGMATLNLWLPPALSRVLSTLPSHWGCAWAWESGLTALVQYRVDRQRPRFLVEAARQWRWHDHWGNSLASFAIFPQLQHFFPIKEKHNIWRLNAPFLAMKMATHES